MGAWRSVTRVMGQLTEESYVGHGLIECWVMWVMGHKCDPLSALRGIRT